MSLYIRLLLSQNLRSCLNILRCVMRLCVLTINYIFVGPFIGCLKLYLAQTLNLNRQSQEQSWNWRGWTDSIQYTLIHYYPSNLRPIFEALNNRTWWILYRANSKQSCDCVQRPVEVKISWNKNCFSRQTLLAFSVWCNPIKVWQLKWKY